MAGCQAECLKYSILAQTTKKLTRNSIQRAAGCVGSKNHMVHRLCFLALNHIFCGPVLHRRTAFSPNLLWKREEGMGRVNEKGGRKGGMNDGEEGGKGRRGKA